jgi:N-acetylneuraminic acid mutarotase
MILNRKNCSWLLAGVMLLAVSCSKNTSSTSTSTTGDWINRYEMNGSVRAEAVNFVIGDTAYVGSGFDGSARLQDFWAYNAASNSWYQCANFPGAARNSAVAFAANNKGYVGTGYDGVNKLKDFWQYDPATNQWTQKQDFGGSARYDAVAFALNDKGYVATGFDGAYLKDVWEYDPIKDQWTEKPNGIGSKRSAAVAFVYNNKAYVVTGTNNGQTVNDFWSYDPTTDNWTELRKISNVTDETYDDDYTDIMRYNAVAFVMGNYAYLSTGETSGYNSNTWRYDFANDQWERRTAFEGAARTGAVGFAVQNRGFVATGNSSTTYFDDVYEFNPNVNQIANN